MGPNKVSDQILQEHLRESMRKVLIALSPNLGISQEQLLGEFEQLTTPGTNIPIDQPRAIKTAASPAAETARLQLDFQHECLHLTCPIRGTYCALCQQNPNRRCEIGNNFAPKQLEKQPLTASCGSSIQISLKHLESVYKGTEILACSASSQPAQEPEGLCLEFSLLSASLHDQWLQQTPEGVTMSEDTRLACEVLRSRKAGKKALLQGGWMSHRTPEHRIRVNITDKPIMHVDLTIQENSEARLGKDVQYKLLVRAINESTNEELAQLVSQGFSVTTMRSKGSLKPIIPCMDDPVNKLEGLGEKTRKNLMDVRACAASLELTGLVPEECPNSVTTVRQFQELVECLEVNNHCPKLLTRALLPEAAMEHALKAVQTDNRVRRWRAEPGSQWELLYRCSRGQVDWNKPDVLMMYGSGGQQTQVSVAGRTTGEQEAKMAELAGQATQAWGRGGHPGWSVDTLDSQYLLQLDQPQAQPALAAYRPKHLQALGAVLGDPATSRQGDQAGGNFCSSSRDAPLRQPGASMGGSAGSGAEQTVPSFHTGLLGFGNDNGLSPLLSFSSVLGSLPGRPLGGSPPRPQGQSFASPLLQSAPDGDPHDGSSSSGSHPIQMQSQSAVASQAQPCGSSNGILTRPRSRRLASKRAQRVAQDSLESSPVPESTDRADERNPEADHQFRQILGQGTTTAGQLPSRRCIAEHFDISQIQKELSIRHGKLLPRSSSSQHPLAMPSQGGGEGVITLDEALDSMSPTTGLSMGMLSPFGNLAGSSWEIPAGAGAHDGVQEGQKGPSSDASATCHEGFSGFASPPLPETVSVSEDPEFGPEVGARPSASLEPARKRSRWTPDEHLSRSPSPVVPTRQGPNSALGQGNHQQPFSKSCWPAGLTPGNSLITPQDMFWAPQGIFQQPLVQGGSKLVPTSPFVRANQRKQQGHCNTGPFVHLGSYTDETDSLGSSLHAQPHTSLLQLLDD